MHHQLNPEQLGPHGDAMARAIQTCVHCGFCLPTCPTYQVLQQEMDSPRGRIFLMKEVLEGNLDPAAAQVHIDRCLGCLACQTHCPSGVAYGELISPFRARRREQGEVGGDRWRRALAAATLPYPERFRWAMRLGRLGKKLRGITPKRLLPMVDMVPDGLPAAAPVAERYPALGTRRGRVALLLGCAQQVLAPSIHTAAIRVLTRNGIEVLVPPDQGCCGALSWHVGDADSAQRFAAANISAFRRLHDLDAIITTAAGCGSAMHEYPLMFAGASDEQRDAAQQIAHRSVDISKYLCDLGIVPPPPTSRPLRVAYHDACHLSHGQKVRAEPRKLLMMLGKVELLELRETEICCGSAGTYNVDHPEIARQLGTSKAQQVIETAADVLALGNIGCLVQIQQHLRQLGSTIPVLHTIELLDRVYHQPNDPLGNLNTNTIT